MINIVLYQPEIPPNTGNIIRLCVNTGCALHLIKPLAFSMDDKSLRRAGLDHHDTAHIRYYDDWEHFCERNNPPLLYTYSTKAQQYFHTVPYPDGVYLVFGPETRGLPSHVRDDARCTAVKIPMKTTSRSMNLSNSVAIGLYEALRQQSYHNLV
jgi:tRNA (cytidine/uridine-2'-O-)-methyltransferase